MNIEADTGVADDLKQTTVFNGNVVLSKGTLLIRGAQLTYREDAQGYQYGTVIAELGKLAFFRQKREGVDEFIEGEAETIIYDGRADTVKFVTKAIMRRLKGAQLNDEMTGAVILLDNVKDQLQHRWHHGEERRAAARRPRARDDDAQGARPPPARRRALRQRPPHRPLPAVRLRPSTALSGDKQ